MPTKNSKGTKKNIGVNDKISNINLSIQEISNRLDNLESLLNDIQNNMKPLELHVSKISGRMGI